MLDAGNITQHAADSINMGFNPDRYTMPRGIKVSIISQWELYTAEIGR